ncbi:hypothetical protein DH2020_041098 [Rehmannia glutinosa]|uniref:Fe2OG dioxygenase domain-containing protein n=1 Tax=Rehmannia glutinosa TaxID=99300 RepID=A0ABR0USL5_REHGL
MGSHGQYTLPVIEFNGKNLIPGTSSWKSTSVLVRQALESYGCFVVAYKNISSELYEETFDLTEELFGLPLETKRRNTSEISGSGYGGSFPLMPLLEYLGFEDGGTFQAANNFTSLMWPDGHHKFCETIYSYCKLLLELDHTVMKMVTSSYNLEKYYDPLIQSSFYMTRVMKYHSPGENKSDIGILPHKDKNFIAVIGTNEIKGLQIETRDGDWIDFEPSPGKFIVIVGEALMVRCFNSFIIITAWSNGRIYCPLHKVTAIGSKEKYSIGLFSFIRGVLEVPDELVDDEYPLKFKPFSNLEFLKYCVNGGPTAGGAIQAYCGI